MPKALQKKKPPSSIKDALLKIKQHAKKGNAVAFYCITGLHKALTGSFDIPEFITQDQAIFHLYAFLIEQIQQNNGIATIQQHLTPTERTGLQQALYPYPAQDLVNRAKTGNLLAFHILLTDAQRDYTVAQGEIQHLSYFLSNQLANPHPPRHAAKMLSELTTCHKLTHLRSYAYAQSALRSYQSSSKAP